jgi:HAE1 family hydrophobic/amphiphilic exporter-1
MSQRTLRQATFVLLTAALAVGPFSSSEILAQTPSGNGQSAPQGPTLSITMEEAVSMALEANLGLRADKLAPQIQAQLLSAAKAYYNPQFVASGSRFNAESAPTSFLDSTATSVSSSTNRFSTGVQQNLQWYGGNYRVSWGGSRSENSSAGNSFNPQLGSSFSVTFTQPLLRNFGTDSARTSVKTNTLQQQISDTVLLENIARTSRDARLQYLNLIGAIEGRKVAQQNLDLARESLKGDRARVEVGLMAPVDIVGSEASVANGEDGLIVAEGQIASAMDQLRQFILDPARADYWTVQIIPSDTITAEARQIDVDAAVKSALENRSDLVQQRRNLEIVQANMSLLHNQTLPSLDFQASYTGTGTAGTQFKYAPGTIDILSQTTKGFGSAIGDAFGYVQPAWTYSLNMAYPIGRSSEKASYARQELQLRQQQLQLREGEVSVAVQVRDAARQVETSFKRVQTARASLDAQVRRLEAEQKRFEVGTSDTLRLFLVQRDLAQARVSELQAELSYQRALINFEAVQHIR